MLRLFVKDNSSGWVHEYGTNRHDALILQDDGSLHYENMQCCVGTKFQKEGYSFCLEDGTIPEWDLEHGVEPYIDIGGEYYTKQHTNADRIRAMSDEELAKILNAFTAYFEECNRSITDTDCHDCELCEICGLGEGKAIDWLQKPVKEDSNGC